VVSGVASSVSLYAFTVEPRHAGIVVGVGQTLSNVVAAVVGLALLRRRFGLLRLRSTVRTYIRLLVASVGAALPTAFMLYGLQGFGIDDTRWSGALVALLLGGVVYLAICFAAAHLLRVEEVGQLLEPVLRRLRRRPPSAGTP
jgi:putative peptidoglycan lipid II flippase